MALSDRQHRDVLDLVGAVNSGLGLDDYRAALLDGVRRMITTDYVSYNELVGGRPTASLVEPDLPAWAYETWGRLGDANPLIDNAVRTRDLRPYRWSDVADMRRLRREPIFTELYARLGIDHQIAFQLPSPPTLMIGVALSRGRDDFTDAEREMLDLARPHLIQAYRSAQLHDELIDLVAAARTGIDARGVGVAVCDEGVVRFASSLAAQAVAESGLGELTEGEPVPAALIDGHRANVFELDGQSLLVRRLEGGGGEVVLTFEPSRQTFSVEALAELGLSRREAEVLAQFARGNDTAATAEALCIAPATVHKHARSVYAKLGVRERSQAVATAWAALGAASSITHP